MAHLDDAAYLAQNARVRDFHAGHIDGKKFSGARTRLCWESIVALVGGYAAKTLLDYGAGRGTQWRPGARLPGVAPDADPRAVLGVDVREYDPGVAGIDRLPLQLAQFDGVVSVDVLEYVADAHIAAVLDEIFSYARQFVFVNVPCDPSTKHCAPDEPWTRAVPQCWVDLLSAAGAAYPAVAWYARIKRKLPDRVCQITAGLGGAVVLTESGQVTRAHVAAVSARAGM